ncbi:D-alanyl-D-alanine carboxypeptidase/D-alanyl-D-alanine-endopeptidase [Nocardioidaceae bacterium]|nr:D-alanyl-D-alanine carboxypeptidase/D-alanyl-D-alanine-endopeptidase [Nocardioidaceae bacterium]
MARPDPPRRTRHGRPLWTILISAAVAGFLGAALLTIIGGTPDTTPPPDPDVLARQQPAALPPPSGLDLPPLGVEAPVAQPLSPSTADPVDVAEVVRPLAGRRGTLGPRVHLVVAGTDGDPLVTVGSGTFIPASLTKLMTAAAVTEGLPRDRRFATEARLEPGTGARPLLHLVGGGDPLLASARDEGPGDVPVADLATLARTSARNLTAVGVDTVRLRYDATLFSGDGRNAAWPADYYADVVAPITALMVDQGRSGTGFGMVADPSVAAAEVYATALEAAGITVRGRPQPATAPAADGPGTDGAPVSVGVVRSAPLDLMVRHMLEVSDNVVAETLAHHLAIAQGRTPDFTGAADASREVLRSLGVPLEGLVLRDASGLSRRNRVAPATIIGVLHEAASADRPALRPVLTGLPVAGFTGSLAGRYADAPAAGLGTVRAKTGTLTGVHGLAGTVVDRDGTEMLFVAVADRVRLDQTLAARDLLARLTARLAACRCGDGRANPVG